MRKLTTMVAISALSFAMFTGCAPKKPVASNPPTVTTPDTPQQKFERSIAGGLAFTQAVSEGLLGADKARKDLNAAGQLDDATSQKILAVLQQIAQKNELAKTACDVANKTGDTTIAWQNRVLDVVTAVRGIDPAFFGIKNPDSQAKVKAAFNALQSVAEIAGSTFAQGGTQ